MMTIILNNVLFNSCIKLYQQVPGRKIMKLYEHYTNIFTWTSLSFNEFAISDLSVRLRYFLAWNSRSSSNNWPLVKAVLLRRDLFSIEGCTVVFCLRCKISDVSFIHFPANVLYLLRWTMYFFYIDVYICM